MSWTLSDAARSAMADAFVAEIDSGSGAGKIQVYSGTRPDGPGTAVTTQTKLLEFTLASPSFAAAVAGVATLDADPDLEATGLANGTATWARIVDGDGNAIADCKVTETGGGGDLILSTTSISIGLEVSITSGTVTMPPGSAD